MNKYGYKTHERQHRPVVMCVERSQVKLFTTHAYYIMNAYFYAYGPQVLIRKWNKLISRVCIVRFQCKRSFKDRIYMAISCVYIKTVCAAYVLQHKEMAKEGVIENEIMPSKFIYAQIDLCGKNRILFFSLNEYKLHASSLIWIVDAMWYEWKLMFLHEIITVFTLKLLYNVKWFCFKIYFRLLCVYRLFYFCAIYLFITYLFILLQDCNKEPCHCEGIKGARGSVGPNGVPGLEGDPGDIGYDGKYHIFKSGIEMKRRFFIFYSNE